MTSLERYYTGHLRSLFISKFRYRDARAVKLVRGMQWTLIAKPAFLPMLLLIGFVSTGQWPIHRRIKRKGRGGVSTATLVACSLTYGRTFSTTGLRVLHKCKFFHFPVIDSGTVISDFLFEMVFVDRSVVFADWSLIVPTILELEGILDGNLAYAQKCAKAVSFRCYFRGHADFSLYYLQSAVRALQVPLIVSTRFEDSLNNAQISFA